MLLRFYFLLSREKKGRARGKKKDKEATQNRRIIKRKRERERRRRKKNGVFQRTRAAWRDEGDTERDSDTHERVTSLERYAKKRKRFRIFLSIVFEKCGSHQQCMCVFRSQISNCFFFFYYFFFIVSIC